MAKKQADNRYRAKVTVDGKAVYISARTVRELEDKKREVRERYIGGVKPREMAFVDLVWEWFNTFKRPRIKAPSTLKNYLNAINNHIIPYFHEKQLVKAVRRADLQYCVDQCAGMSYINAEMVCSILHHSCLHAITEGMIQVDPSAALMKPMAAEQSEKDAFTHEQEEALLDVAAKNPYGMMIYLLYYLGIRRGEMLGLRWGDIDWQKKTVHIQRDVDFNAGSSSKAIVGDIKTKASNRVVPIPNELIEILRPYRSLPNMYIVSVKNNEPLSSNLYRVRWNRMMQEAGYVSVSQKYKDRMDKRAKEGKPIVAPNIAYDYDVAITAHWFRHHYITALVEAEERPEIIKTIVGHRQYDTTINVYTHIKEIRKDTPPTLLSAVFRREIESRAANK